MKNLQLYLDATNREILNIMDSIKTTNNKPPISKVKTERIMNEAIKLREKINGVVMGYNLFSNNGSKIHLIEEELLLEVKMFDTDEYEFMASEKIYTYKLSEI